MPFQKGNNANPKGNPQNLIPGASGRKNWGRQGIFSEEMRERLRPIVADGAELLHKILKGESPTEGNPDPTASEIVNAWKAVAPYVMSELKPVMDEALCRIVAEVLAEDDRIPFEAIGDVTSKLIERLGAA